MPSASLVDAPCQSISMVAEVGLCEDFACAIRIRRRHRPFLGQAARGHIPERVRHIHVELRQLGVVDVAAQEDDAIRLRPPDQVEKTLPLALEGDPGLPAREIGEHLQAGCEQAKFRGHLELPLEPLPLPLAEHRRLRVGIARIRARHVEALREPRPHPGLEVGAAEVLPHERRPVVTKVRQDHLHAPARRSEDIGGIDAVAFTARRVGGLIPEVEEDAAGLLLHRIFATRIVLAVIVVVPDRDERCLGPQPRKAGLRRELRVLSAEHRHVARVPIDVVAEEYEQVELPRVDGIPDRLRLARFGAGTKTDSRQCLPERRVGIGAGYRDECDSSAPVASKRMAARARQHRRRPATGEAVPAARDRDRPGSWRGSSARSRANGIPRQRAQIAGHQRNPEQDDDHSGDLDP